MRGSSAFIGWLLALALVTAAVLWTFDHTAAQEGEDGPPTATAQSQPRLVPRPAELVLRGPVNTDLRGTVLVSVADGPVDGVTVQSSDLVAANGARILGTAVDVDPDAPPTGALGDTLRFTITVAGSDRAAGVYVGDLFFHTQELSGRPVLTVPLTADFAALPAVEVEPKSQNQTLSVQTGFCDVPYLGRPTAPQAPAQEGKGPGSWNERLRTWFATRVCGAGALLGELPIYLVQKTATAAIVEHAQVLNVAQPGGVILPGGVVTTTDVLPLVIPARQAAALRVVIAGENLPAGAYEGDLHISVQDTPEPLRVSMKFNIKHNSLYAMAALLLSLAFAPLLAAYNQRGVANRLYLDQVENRDHRLAGMLLTLEQKTAARRLLDQVMDVVMDGRPESEIRQKLAEYDEWVAKEVEAMHTALRAELAEIRKMVDGLGPIRLAAELAKRLDESAAKIDRAEYASTEEAQRDLARVRQEASVLQELLALGERLPPALRDRLKDAESIEVIVETFKAEFAHQLDSVQQQIEAAQDSDQKNKLVQELAGLRTDVEGAGAADIGALLQRMEDLTSAAGQLQPRAGIPPAQIPQPAATAALAGDLAAAGAALAQLGRKTPQEESLAAYRQRRWEQLKRKTRWLRVVVLLIAYLFALWVGWATLYWSSATFGQNPEDYIKLFLWGAAVNLVTAQSISLDTIYQRPQGQAPGNG